MFSDDERHNRQIAAVIIAAILEKTTLGLGLVGILGYGFRDVFQKKPPIKESAKSIEDALDKILKRTSWEKRDVCHGLHLVDQNFADWYEELNNHLVNPMSDKTLQDFNRFVGTRAREPAAIKCREFLTKLTHRYSSESEIDNLLDYINGPFFETIGKKVAWLDFYNTKQPVDFKVINDWKLLVRRKTDDFHNSIVSMRNRLGCPEG